MGKSNKANRTKGNTRPSSSDHSAQLLSLSGKSLSGFIGFDSLEKDIPTYVPVTGQHSSDASDLSVDSDFRMVMRKMLKRDNITRLKALQEFANLCSEKDVETLKNVLPFWPRLFNKLALDYDRRVREATHVANGKLISNVKREIAPYLKNIMGVWLLGQNDLHAPSSSAAQSTFTATFPKAKQSEALMYCKNEIFAYYKDNLFEQTAKTLSDPSSTSAEDMENKYTLVISATLQALKLFLITISPNEYLNVHNDYFAIISDNKFWKFAKSKEMQIRSSWYGLISLLCHKKPDLFDETQKKLVTTVFGSLSENDPVVAPYVWESALHIVVNFKNCWQEVNIQKVVLPQLWSVLNEGGRGNARMLYPCILPFLSKFPKEIISKESFLQQLFSCLKQSLFLDSVKLSTTECDAILTTFMECLLYISFNVLDSTKDVSGFIEKVLSDNIFPLVESSFYDKKFSYLASTKFYSLLSTLVQKLENKCFNEDDEASKIFSQILNLFWDNIYHIFCKFFDIKENEKAKVSLYISYFFHSIFLSSPLLKTEKNKVRFEDDEEGDISHSKLEDVTSVSPEYLRSEDLYKKMPLTFAQMIKFVKTLCQKTDESIDLYCLKILNEILGATLNPEFLKIILKSFEESYETSEKNNLTLFNKVILKWLKREKLDPSSIMCISDIVFSLCSSISEEECVDMLNTCCKVNNPVFLESVLNKGLSQFSHEPVFQKWLRSPDLVLSVLHGLKEMMKSLATDEVVNKEYVTAHKNILLICLANKCLQDTLNENKGIEEILLAFKDCLEKGPSGTNIDCILEICCSVVETLLLNYENCWSHTVTDDLLSLLFQCNFNAVDYKLPETACAEISKVWNTAIQSSCESNVVTKEGSFVIRVAKYLNLSLMDLKTSDKASRTHHEIIKLVRSIEEVLSSLPNSCSTPFILSKVLENILPSDNQWKTLREGLSFSYIPSFVEGKIIYPAPEKEKYEVPKDVIYKLFMVSKVISQIFVQDIEKQESSKEQYLEEDSSNSLLYLEQFIVKHVPHLFWCLSYCCGNGYMNKDLEINLDSDVLENHCAKILEFLSFQKLKEVITDIFYCSICEGLYWCLPFDLLMEKVKQLHPESINLFTDLISEAMLMESDHVPLNVQILSHHIDKNKKVFYLKNLLGDLIEKDCSLERINEDFLIKLGEVCCYIQHSESLDDEVKNLFSIFFKSVLRFNCPKELEYLFSLQITSLISSLVQCAPDLVTQEIWNHLQLLLSYNIENGKLVEYNKPEDIVLLHEVSLLYSTSFSFIKASKDIELSWNPTVSGELIKNFISLFIHIGVAIKKFYLLPQTFKDALTGLLKAIEFIPENILFDYVFQSQATFSEYTSKTEKLSNPLDCLLLILLSDIQHLQTAAHVLLIRIMPLLSESVSSFAKSESEDNEDEEEKIPSILLPLVETLKPLNELMEGMLWDVKFGECCLVLPYTEPYAFVSAYLFAWLQMLEFISTSPFQVRSGYIANLEEGKLLSSLFSNVCRLMPENPMSCLKVESDTPKKESLVSLFLQPPVISAGYPSPEEIQTIACYVFCFALRKVPASVRTWWNNLDKKSADIVNKFTSKYISGILYTEEIQAVHNNENLFKNMVVKARLGSREVIATYTVDDFTIELCVQLPANYPLGPITAEKRGKVIISTQEWRHWLMQLATVLNYQNGSILDGLNIWKKNLEKKFEGVEECMICYYILHSSTLKLPKVSCNTCRKKFHSACLYKWFHSINNTKCPLCRTEFTINYRN